MNSKSCSVGDLEKNETISIFGMGIEDGFHNVKYPFYWTGMYNYTKDNVRMKFSVSTGNWSSDRGATKNFGRGVSKEKKNYTRRVSTFAVQVRVYV